MRDEAAWQCSASHRRHVLISGLMHLFVLISFTSLAFGIIYLAREIADKCGNRDFESRVKVKSPSRDNHAA